MGMKAFLTGLITASSICAATAKSEPVDIAHFKHLFEGDPSTLEHRAAHIKKNWHDSYAPMLIESLRFSRNNKRSKIYNSILSEKTGLSKRSDISDYWQWAWSKPYQPHPKYDDFKAFLYQRIDPRFEAYFDKSPKSNIRLDEIRWGGVLRDGIPPLKNPKTLKAEQADYLDDKDIVFGVHFNGRSRAYPKRILAWHEMVKDTVGGKSINGVYCTLCGSMIVYDTKHKGKHYELGTSGFLYRSNKLMYDHKTESMWSTIEGKPVVGPLVGKGIQLRPLTVVTTTWGEWKRRHPGTTVLSLDTGHHRDYGEGVAYRSYFATDRLMFQVPDQLKDKRLKNKASVLALRFGPKPNDKVAFSPKFLRKNPVYNHQHGGTKVVILTDSSGASRVYQSDGINFSTWDQNHVALDNQGQKWTLTEDGLTSSAGKKLSRFPSHNAFWFGWVSAYPETQLVQ